MSSRVRRKPSPNSSSDGRVDDAVDRRVEQHLRAWRRPAFGRGQLATTAARLPPALSPPTAILSGIAPSAAGVRTGPAEGREGILDRRGEGVLGRKPVIDRQDVDVGIAADAPAQSVMGVEVARHEAAAVVVDQQRAAGRLSGWRVVACGDDVALAAGRWRDRRQRRPGSARPAIVSGLAGAASFALPPRSGPASALAAALHAGRAASCICGCSAARHRPPPAAGPTAAPAGPAAAQTSCARPGIRDAGARSGA